MKRLSFILSFIVCICVANTNDVFSQKRELQQFKGKVTNQEGEPVPYVSIYVPGTGRETSSDMSGNFSIKAKHKETVYFRYIGMKDVQIQLDKDNPSEILVQIKPDTFLLDNVIIRKKQIIEVKPEDIPNDIMITIIEHSPDFPGGLSGLREYLKKSIQYPKKAFRAGEEGQVTIEFTIDPKGNVINKERICQLRQRSLTHHRVHAAMETGYAARPSCSSAHVCPNRLRDRSSLQSH